MKKLAAVIIGITIALQVQAQKDSVQKLRISGFQLDLALLGSTDSDAGHQKFVQYMTKNNLFMQDLKGFTGPQGGYSTTRNVDGHVGAKIFIDLPSHCRSLRAQLVLGLRFGSVVAASAYYSKENYDTTGVYINPANNSQLTQVDQYSESYNYSVLSSQLMLPLGINISTNMKKRFWFTAGIELAPGITFNNRLMSYNGESSTQLLLNEHSNLKDFSTFSRGPSKNIYSSHQLTQLKDIGFSGSATIPLSANIRLAKHIKFFDHLNLAGALAPGISTISNKFSGSHSNFIINASVGLRYNL